MYQSESFLKEKERIAKSRAAHLRLMASGLGGAITPWFGQDRKAVVRAAKKI
ncbi:MAG: hypothetical protein HWE12_09590 [Oceanospirillaceae bacterium]|nr:hypothetical protein [Oceanospirillaceae bacterium]